MEDQLLALLQKARDDLDESARAELNDLIRNDAQARNLMAKLLVDEQALIGHLRDESIVSLLNPAEQGKASSTRQISRLSFGRLGAAVAAGLVIGMVCVSVVFGYARPQAITTFLPIAHGDFETLPVKPVDIGFPVRFGVWSGNPAEVIEKENGNRSLRFLETGNVKGDPNGFASNCSVFQLIDLSSLRQQRDTDPSEAQISLELSARFHRESAPSDAQLPELDGSLRIFLFQAEPESIGKDWPMVVNTTTALGKRTIKLKPGDESTTISTSCILDSEATVALIVVAANTGIQLRTPIELGGYFVDDVQLTLIRQPKLPVRFVK